MAVIECTSVMQFLTLLHEIQWCRQAEQGRWFFRGQDQKYTGLVPSLYRQTLNIPAQQFQDAAIKQLTADLTERSSWSGRLLEVPSLTALAQHYGWQHKGCPTRMLDMTLSPMVGAYFAAAGAIREASDEPLVVYAIAQQGLERHDPSMPIIAPRAGVNENLARQSGVLVLLDENLKNLWRPEYEASRSKNEIPVEAKQQHVGLNWSSRFLRFELPRDAAPDLLEELGACGVDAISLFPGNHGYVQAAGDAAWLYHCRVSKSVSPPAKVSDDDELTRPPRISSAPPLGIALAPTAIAAEESWKKKSAGSSAPSELTASVATTSSANNNSSNQPTNASPSAAPPGAAFAPTVASAEQSWKKRKPGAH